MALNIASPFVGITPQTAASQWRLWYQWALSAPVLGPRAVASVAKKDGALHRWLGGGARAWNDAELHAFLDQFDEPDRVRASVHLYRRFQYRDLPAALGVRYRRLAPLRAPVPMLYGTGDHIIRPAHLAGLERFAPRSSIEYVDSGHFVVDERPELVLDRTRAFFAEN